MLVLGVVADLYYVKESSSNAAAVESQTIEEESIETLIKNVKENLTEDEMQQVDRVYTMYAYNEDSYQEDAEYLDSSLLMQLNPEEIPTVLLSYQISRNISEEEIRNIMTMYESTLLDETSCADIVDVIGKKYKNTAVKELVSITDNISGNDGENIVMVQNVDSGILNIRIYALEQKQCEKIADVTDAEIEKIEEQIAVVERLTKDNSELEKQCILFAKSKLAVKKDEDSKKAMDLLMEAIHITLPEFDGKNPLRNNLLTFDEIMIINSIAVRHAKNGDFFIAIQIEMWLKEYMEEKIVDGKMKTAKYPMILYNLSCWLDDEKCYKEELRVAEEGIDFCINYGNLVAFPRLILNKAIALVQMGNTTEAEKYLHQAITVFEAMKKMDIVEHIRTWCRSHYSIEL